MTILKRTYFIAILLFALLFACQTTNQNAKARPNFVLPPIEMGAIKLEHTDTNSAEWKMIAARLDSFYEVQKKQGFNGSVLIGYKGQILYEKYIGYANKSNGTELSSHNASQLASTTKTFTGAAILYLYQNKYIDIDQPVAQYISNFPYPDITVRMLLCHRSGLPNYWNWLPQYYKSKEPIGNDEVLQLMAKHKPPVSFKANTKFVYSNTNYLILASIIEEVTEMSFDKFMKTYIFDPLGMKNTFVYNANAGLPSSATFSYQNGYSIYPNDYRDGVYGDKGIFSTVEDMYRWDQSFYQNKFLSNETLEIAYGPCSFERKGIKNYGLGWRMMCYPDGYKIIYHNGWWHGNNTCFYRFIKDNFTIIVLGNKLSNAIYRQPQVLYSIVKNTEPVTGFEEGED